MPTKGNDQEKKGKLPLSEHELTRGDTRVPPAAARLQVCDGLRRNLQLLRHLR